MHRQAEEEFDRQAGALFAGIAKAVAAALLLIGLCWGFIAYGPQPKAPAAFSSDGAQHNRDEYFRKSLAELRHRPSPAVFGVCIVATAAPVVGMLFLLWRRRN